MAYWALFGGASASVFSQASLPEVELIGRDTPPFPVHVQCRTLQHAQNVVTIHDKLVRWRARGINRLELASSLHSSASLPQSFTESGVWYTVLNGITFKGILHRKESKDEQTLRHQYASVRQTHCLRDALIHIILGGDNEAYKSVASASLLLPMDRLSLTAVSYHMDEANSFERSHCKSGKAPSLSDFSLDSSSSSTSSAPTIKIPRRTGDRGSALSPLPASTSIASASTIKNSHRVERGRGPAPNRLTSLNVVQSVQPPTVHKYLRGPMGVVGTITDPSGVTPIDLSEIEDAVGVTRAKYLDAHGYGIDSMRSIANAYQIAEDGDDFISRATGYGMSAVELEWFWEFSWAF